MRSRGAGTDRATRLRGGGDYGRAAFQSQTEVRSMPAKTEKQRKFMGAELQRKREGKETQTDMSEKELEKMASKPDKKKD
jgi:hypothetical protein